METLIASLQLQTDQFTSALQQASQRVQAFSQQVASQMAAATQSLSSNTTATQANAAANNALLIAMQNLQGTARQQVTTLQQISTQIEQVSTASHQAASATSLWSQALAVFGGVSVTALFRGLIRDIKEFVTESISGFAEFERGLLKIATLMPTMTKGAPEFARLGEAIHALAVQTGIDTANIQKAMFDVQSTFGTGKQREAFEVLRVGAELAVGGFTDLSTATGALSAVMKDFNLATTDTTKVANALIVASNQNRVDFEKFAKTLPLVLPTLSLFKVSLESAGAALAVATGNGLEAGKSVTGLNQALLAIGAPTVRAQKYLEELARQTGVTTIGLKRFADGTVDLVATVKQFEGIQPDLLRRLFGGNVEALRTMAILTEHVGDLQSRISEAATTTGEFQRQSALAHSGIQQQWKQSMQAAKAFYDAVGSVVGQSPALAGMVAGLQAAFLSLVAAIQANKPELETLIEAFAKLGQVGIAVFETLGQAAIYLGGAVGAAMDKILAGINSVVRAYNWIKENIPLVGSGSSGPVFTFEGGEGMAASMKMAPLAGAPVGPAPGSPGPVVPLGPPRTGLGMADIQAGLDAHSKAATREAERAAEERARITQQMLEDIAELEDGAYAKKKMRLDQELKEARAALVAKGTIAQYERDMLIDLAMETTDALTTEFGKRVASATAAMKAESAQIDTERKALASLRTLGEADDPIERQRLAGMQRVNELFLALENSRIVTSTQLARDRENAETAVNQKALDDRQQQMERAAKEALRPWRQLAEDIQHTLSSAFENVLAGTFSVWDGIKRGFIKLLADLAAAAITQQIIIPLAMRVLGATGGLTSAFLGAGGTGTIGGGAEGTTDAYGETGTAAGTSGALGSALGMASSGASLYQGISGQSLLGGNAVMKGLLNTPLSSIFGGAGAGAAAYGSSAGFGGGATGATMATADIMGAGESGGLLASSGGGEAGASALGGATVGTIAGGVGVGIAAGQIFAKLNAMMGLHGTGNKVLSGAGGGAIAGAMIGSAIPIVGTAVGAVAGALIGALGGYISSLFGPGKPKPMYDPTAVQAAQVAYNPTQGLQLTATMGITRDIHRDVGGLQGWQATVKTINEGLADMAQQVVSQFQGVAPELQQALVDPLNTAFNEIAAKIGGLKIAGDTVEEFTANLQEMMGTTLPAYFNDAMTSVVAKLQETVKKIEPVFNAFNAVIDTLQKDIDAIHGQQLEMHTVIQAARNALRTTLQSPAEAFLTAQGQYGRAKTAFEGGNAIQQIHLAPVLAQAAQQLLSMSKSEDVLGQDPILVRNLQTSLLQDLDMLEARTDTAFTSMTDVLQAQVDAAEAQKKALISGLANPASLDQTIATSLEALSSIQNAIAASQGEGDPLVQAQVALLGGLTTIGTAQLQVLTDISQKLGGGVGGFAEGSQYVPQNMLAYIHAGERITPASNNYGGDTIHVSVNVNGGGSSDQTANQIANAVIAEIEKRGGRYGTTSIQVRR